MEFPKLLIDTSIIIDFLRKKNKENTLFWKIINEYDCYISTITEFELFCGAITDEKKLELEKIINSLQIINFDENASLKSAEIFLSLRSKNKNIEFRDIFIAATAIVADLPLSTLNQKHFNRISELKLQNIDKWI